MALVQTEVQADAVSEEFKRGACAAAEAMRFYFLDEDEGSMHETLTEDELETFETGAVNDALRDEENRQIREAERLARETQG